jgi:methylthioribulose-1-phosphate dehydratase
MNFNQLAQQLVDAGRILYDWGMVPATSGNFSARIDKNEIAITISGKHKGRMTATDIMRIDSAGLSLDGNKPSAETGLHVQIYQHYPETNAILHAHSINATLLSQLATSEVVLKDYELLKAFPGITTHVTQVSIPVFENDQDIRRLALLVDDYMNNPGVIPAYLIRGHGFYTWGNSIDDALKYTEALEFLFKCDLTLRGVIQP